MPDQDEAVARQVDGAVVQDLLESGDTKGALAHLGEMEAADIILVLSRLSTDVRSALVIEAGAEDGADLIERLPEHQIVETIADLEPSIAAKVLEEFPSDTQADVIGSLEHEDAVAIIDELRARDAQDVRLLTAYDGNVAGGLMITEYLAYQAHTTIAEVITDLGTNAEHYADYDIQYAYVTDEFGRLIGVLRLRDLLLSPRMRTVESIMIESPASVHDDDALEQLVAFFDEFRFFGVPVVNEHGVLCGVVQRAAVEAAVADDSDRVYLSTQGIVGGEELRSMPLLVRSRRRLSWLSVNIVLNIVAASVIALHQETLEAVIALAVFLPIISDMSGCSGNQAVAVSMRELTLGVTRPTEVARAVFGEASVGLINGIALGLLIGAVAWLWKGNAWLGLVVGGALAMNTLIAVIIGGVVPLVLKRMKVDPALAAGPILTTVTDMCGFFIVLTFASAMLNKIA